MRVSALSIVIFSSLLTACVVDPGPPPTGGQATACTFEYAPVCGEKFNRRETYSNACMARADGARIVHRGECAQGSFSAPGPAIGE